MRLQMATALTCLAIQLLTTNAQAELSEFKIKVPEPRLEVDSLGYSHIRMDNYLNRGAPGSPALPARARGGAR